jgi:hypothetical protein
LIAKTNPRACLENIILFKNYRITVLTDRLFRIEHSENGNFCDLATQAVWFRNTVKVEHTKTIRGNIIMVKTEKVTLVLNASEFFRSGIKFDRKIIPFTNAGNLKGTARTLDMSSNGKINRENKITGKPESVNFDSQDFLENGVISKTGVAI